MFILRILRGPDKGKELRLQPGKTYTVGGDEDASITLTDPMVLKGHCSIEVDEGFVTLVNHTASAGTFIGDKKISQAKLRANSNFRVGDTILTLAPAPQRKPRAPSAPDPLLGKILGGYKLQEVVGEGGMGKVYRATQLSLHRDVALKVLKDELAKDKSFRDLFINEARAAAQLVHPNIVQVYDGGAEGDVVYFSMEFIGQGSVEEILQRDKQIAWEDAILMVLEAAHGLEYAEKKHIVHRDVKPDNLMINDDGRVKIADLGLAKRGEGARQQGIIGTPHFIPPEQALGKEVDNRADIYSLGATFFRMITGKTLFTGKTAKEIVLKHIKEPPPAASSVLSSVPDDLELVLAKMLAKDPDKRYQTATDLIQGLEEVCAHHGIKGSIIKKGVGKRVLIPLVVLLLGAGGVAYHFATKEPEKFDNPELIAAQKAAEKRAQEQERKRREQERVARRANANTAFSELENEELRLAARSPIEAVFDDPDEAGQREDDWRNREKAYRKFAEGDDAQDFGLDTKATQRADEIDKALEDGRAAQKDKRAKIDVQVKKAEKIAQEQRDALADLKRKRRYEEAFNLADRVSDNQPRKDDPFRDVVAWIWVSPINEKVTVPATKIPLISKVVDDARKFHGREKRDIPRQALKDWNSVLERTKALREDAGEQAYRDAIADLQKVLDNFVSDTGPRNPQIRSHAEAARTEQQRLDKVLNLRVGQRLEEDRVLIRATQRKQCSLDPEQIPNSVMQCGFLDAIDAWNKLLENEDIQTERYRAFTRERIQMLRWCDYLFARFHADMKRGDAFRTDELVQVPLPDKILDKGVKLTKPTDDIYEFTINKRYKRKNVLEYAPFPMNWVYHTVFLHRGEPRWKTTPPAIEFALGAFCFETMQYAEAKRHFEKLVGDERYGAVAKALLTRAEMERIARQEWEQICSDTETADSTKAIEEVRRRALSFGKRHGRTIFHLEVMERGGVFPAEFYDHTTAPKIPKAPPRPSE